MTSNDRVDAARPYRLHAGAVLLSAVLAACGGGGGGGGGGNTSPVDPNAGRPTPGSCPSTRDVDPNGFTLGVCSAIVAGSEANDSAFKTLNAPVSIVDFAAKTYELAVPSPAGSTVRFTESAEDRCQNVLGAATGLTLQVPTVPGRDQPRTALLSFTQGTGGADPVRCSSVRARPAALALSAIDFGTWERYNGGQELYYAGWYVPRTGPGARPTASLSFGGVGGAAAAREGLAVGYVFTALSSYGLSAALTGVRFEPGTNQLSGQLSTFQYSRAGQTTGASLDATITTATFTATVDANGNFAGTLTGTGGLSQPAVAAGVNGRIEGVMVRAASGNFEVAARWQASIAVSGASNPGARAVGSLAIAQ